MSDSNVNDPKLKNVLDQLAPFGFQFYALSEDGMPLVIGPNNQITEINVAISFANSQIQKQRETDSSPKSFEDMPENMPSSPSNFESGNESALESLDSGVETSKEKKGKSKKRRARNKDISVQEKAPTITLPKKEIKPYGDGFDPISFNPGDLKRATEFVNKSSKKRKTSSDRWLAILFKKFLEEISDQTA